MAEATDPGYSLAELNETIARIPLTRRPSLGWLGIVLLGGALTGVLLVAITWLLIRGVGVWGVNIPVAWGFAITNFVWWIGIGHAGTFISAFLLLMHADWRTSINRFAEAMTLFAVLCAGMFPLLHLGRPWLFYFLAPYPDTMGLWPQWRSALVWDLFAVSTYLVVSLVFWYLGLLPDLATMRDRAEARWAKRLYGLFAMGWRGSVRHWRRYEMAYLLLGGLATPLVVSVHSVVSLDFASAVVPGWHSTIMPPYFVAGAIFSGFAMVVTLSVPLRKIYGLERLITEKHLDNMGKLMLVTGLVVAYDYLVEAFMAWYGGDPYERDVQLARVAGPYGWVGWLVLLCNVAVPQALWRRGVRTHPWRLFAVSLVVQVGMWSERFMIVVMSLQRDFLPSSWGQYVPTVWDWLTLVGTLGLFTLAFALFVRLVPALAMAEGRQHLYRVRTGKGARVGEGGG